MSNFGYVAVPVPAGALITKLYVDFGGHRPVKSFPILLSNPERREYPECPPSVPWILVEPHEKQAKANHYQTLARLAQRGGLSPIELLAVLHDQDYYEFRARLDEVGAMAQAVDMLTATLAEYATASGGSGGQEAAPGPG